MKTRNNKKGITLVSLVITIAVLIILAGVSISTTLGENGIITKAKQAKQNIELAVNEEEESLANLEIALKEGNGEIGKYEEILKLKEQIKNLEQQIVELKAKQATGTATEEQVLEGYTFSNSKSVGKLGSMPNRGTLNWNPTTNTNYTIPAGYYSGGTLNSSGAYNAGYNAHQINSRVIYDKLFHDNCDFSINNAIIGKTYLIHYEVLNTNLNEGWGNSNYQCTGGIVREITKGQSPIEQHYNSELLLEIKATSTTINFSKNYGACGKTAYGRIELIQLD